MKGCLINNKKKIAFCISSFRAGGGERVMIDLANSFAKRGHDVDLAVLKPVGQYTRQVDSRVRVVSLDASRIFFSLPKLVAYLHREQPGVLLALDEYTHLLAIIAKQISGVQTKIVLRIGNILSELFKRYQGWKNKLFLPVLVKIFYKKADGIIANSLGVRDDVIKVTKIESDRVSVVHNPKDIAFIRERMKEDVEHTWLARKTVPVIIAVGRLRVQKNLHFLIRAFKKVAEAHPARLIIVGAGREEDSLRGLLRDIDCEDIVSLPGYFENPYAFMGKADIFVSASLWEGMPNSVLEAMACGLPIVASDCNSGPREILAPESDYKFRIKKGFEEAPFGILCAVNDEQALVAALCKMLEDTDLRNVYAQASEKRSKDFDMDVIVNEYESVLLPVR